MGDADPLRESSGGPAGEALQVSNCSRVRAGKDANVRAVVSGLVAPRACIEFTKAWC